MEAQVWMTGRVGSEVECRTVGGSAWSTFRMGCTPRTVRGGEWGDEQTTWVTVSCTNRLAEHVLYSLRKGDPVVVVGRLRTNRWHDADGVEHEQLRIRATSVGHDLTQGTSTFYRRRRDVPADESLAEGEVEVAEATAVPDGDELDEAEAARYEDPDVAERADGDAGQDTGPDARTEAA